MDTLPLIVVMGYGDEHPLYQRARDLWSIYRGFFKDVEIVFLRSSSSFKEDEYSYISGEYVFGQPSDHSTSQHLSGMAAHDAQGYMVDRMLKFFRALLHKYKHPFWVYTATVTSAIDFRLLRKYVDNIECRNIFAGHPLYSVIPDGLSEDMPSGHMFRMVSGAGTLLSSDLVDLIVSREALVNHNMLVDVWTSLILRDIPRMPVYRSDILNITDFSSETRSELNRRIKREVERGAFYFRVKSGRWEPDGTLSHTPEHVDLLVINEILLSLLSNPQNEEVIFKAWSDYRLMVCDAGGDRLVPVA